MAHPWSDGWTQQAQSDKEIASEANAELQMLFPLIRSFYFGNSEKIEAVRDVYGQFPSSWQEFESWPHFKVLRKRYLAFTDGVILDPPTATEASVATTVDASPPAAEETPTLEPPNACITVSNLDHTASSDMLTQVFGCFGGLEKLVLVKDETSGSGTVCAVIQFGSEEAATQALALNGMALGAKTLAVVLGGTEYFDKDDTAAESAAATAVPAAPAPVAAPSSSVAPNTTSTERKRSRWGAEAADPAADPTSGAAGAAAATGARTGERKRRNRWGDNTGADAKGGELAVVGKEGHAVMAAAHNPVMVALGLSKTLTQEEEQEAVVLRMQVAQAERALQPQQIIIDAQNLEDAAPRYDAVTGLRTNTKEQRMKEMRLHEREVLIERICVLDPMFRPPTDYVRKKPSAKLYIPYKEYPTYNFIGLVIGPRGNTQKAMEREANCKISIRGRGSVKEGSRGRNDGKYEDENDELHVYISGETKKAVDMGVELVTPLLVPVDDEGNAHKQAQLKELALINGTLKEDDFCPICGEQGHRQFNCPSNVAKSYAAANVRCANCGETSHPTRDCPLAAAGSKGTETDAAGGNGANKAAVLDEEYLSFMDELSGNKQEAKPNAAAPPQQQQEEEAGAPAASTTTTSSIEEGAAAAVGSSQGLVSATPETTGQPGAPPAPPTAATATTGAPPPPSLGYPPSATPAVAVPSGVPPLPSPPASLAPLLEAGGAGLNGVQPKTPEEAEYLAHYFAHQHMQQAMAYQQQQQQHAAYYYQQQQQQQQYGGYAGYYQPQGQYAGYAGYAAPVNAPGMWPAQQPPPQQQEQQQQQPQEAASAVAETDGASAEGQ